MPTPLFIQRLRETWRRPDGQPAGLIETHISWVLLSGEYAFKIKKPVDLGFLNFHSLPDRHRFCLAELELNRRLAPELYLDVVPIAGTPQQPRPGGDGAPFEFAVQMQEFPQADQADQALAAGRLGSRHFNDLAVRLADFHERAARQPPEITLGTPEAVWKPASNNFDALLDCAADARETTLLQGLAEWSRTSHTKLQLVFASRRQDGFVRECHGDLHLANLVLRNDQLIPFDCIEFNDALRWIDIMSDAAFLVMDLAFHGRDDLAWCFLNADLETSGDYAGLAVLPWYLVYRALVRAKVACIRARQADAGAQDRDTALRDYHAHLDIATRFASPHAGACLIITHGLSGSGKTTRSGAWIERHGGVRVRSDVERKRLHGVTADARTKSAPGGGIYTPQANRATYDRLAQLADAIVSAGFTAIVDAAFLKRPERDRFRALADRLGVPFHILACEAPVDELRKRIAHRAAQGKDPSEANFQVLDRQLAALDPLEPQEKCLRLPVKG